MYKNIFKKGVVLSYLNRLQFYSLFKKKYDLRHNNKILNMVFCSLLYNIDKVYTIILFSFKLIIQSLLVY